MHQSPLPLVQYKDKHRERQRRQQLARAAAAPPTKTTPGSGVDKKAGNKTTAHGDASQDKQQEKHLPAAKRRQVNRRQELVDLEDDYRLLKKLKRGKISQVG